MEENLLREMPQVLRARDYRLYTRGGGRLVDLWQNGGAAILGHSPQALLRELKNTAGRGLYAPLPHFLEARFTKALAGLFPGRTFRVYASPPPALEALLQNKIAAFWRPFLDPAKPLTVPPPGKAPYLSPCSRAYRAGERAFPSASAYLPLPLIPAPARKHRHKPKPGQQSPPSPRMISSPRQPSPLPHGEFTILSPQPQHGQNPPSPA